MLTVPLSVVVRLVVLGAALPTHALWLGRTSHTLAAVAERFHLLGEGNCRPASPRRSFSPARRSWASSPG